MTERKKYVFKINGGHTVAAFPMERLALYLADLAKMLGAPESVHFVDITEGSTNLAYTVDAAADQIVEDRIEQIARGEAEVVHMEAFRSLNRRLREDKADGEIFPEGRSAILPFPGIIAPAPVEFIGIPKVGSIDGTVIRIGGRRQEIHVTVQTANALHSKCLASKAVAKALAAHMFDDALRLYGTGRWSRNDSGAWTLQKFVISHFEPLDVTPLSQVIAEVREIGKNGWSGDDLWASASEIRGSTH